MLNVVTAVIRDNRGRILIQKRSRLAAFGGLWETPGGKVEGNESHTQALQRELMEELNFHNVTVGEKFLMTRFYPPLFPVEGVVHLYWASTEETPVAMEGQEEIIYIDLKQMDPDDLVPSAKVLRAYLRTMNGR